MRLTKTILARCLEAGSKSPLIVSCGVGVDSVAMLVGLWKRGERPALILFADTGDEKPETYAYIPVLNAWLRSVGFPELTIVKNARPKSGDKSLSESVMRLGVMPALAYGAHQCSLVWKRDPQHKYIKTWAPAIEAWMAGQAVVNCIGYDAGPRDSCRSYKAEGKASPGFVNRFPLIEWGWDREECKRQIESVGLPVPVKSACFHCPASKKHEITWLRDAHPVMFQRALDIERQALPKMEARKAEGKKVTSKGLGRTFAWATLA